VKISNFSLAIGIPLSFPMVPASFFYSFAHMEKPKEYTLIHADNGPVDTLRNDLVTKALQLGASHLVMLDTDQVYPADTIPRLLEHKLPLVGAVVHRRYPPFDPLLLRGTLGNYESLDAWEPGALVEVDATGAGALLLYDLDVFRRMPAPWFRFRHLPNGEGIGEDIGFCSDLRAAGYQIHIDTRVQVGHLATLEITAATYALYKAMKIQQHQVALARALNTGDAAT
jgi:hypothetical protein